jgi:L-lactate dehydrogenase (cytochrome)
MNADLMSSHPLVSDLAQRARRRMPHFAWEYLDSGTGLETAIVRNRTALDSVTFNPRFMKGDLKPDVSTRLFGRDYAFPLGVSPVGLTGMMWPGGELMLARAAKAMNIPYCLSSFACEGPEAVGAIAGGNGWFQLYTMGDKAAEADIISRVDSAGFSVLVVTVDVPVSSTRERQKKAGLGRRPAFSLSQLLQILARPQWALATARRGKPTLRTVEKYFPGASMAEIARILDQTKLGMTATDDIKRLRELWKKPLVIKGVMHPDDAQTCLSLGADAIVVSNHGARQLDAVPAAIEVLPAIKAAVGSKMPVLFDSGVRTGLDMARAIALGADFVMAGRPFIHGVAAFGEAGGAHVATLLANDLANTMIQIGVASLPELRKADVRISGAWR